MLKLFLYRFVFRLVPDSLWIRMQFRRKVGCWPNLKKPRTFNEKLQWLKLYDRNPLCTKLVDKYEVKKIVGNLIGNEYIIPTLGVWDKFDDIDFDKLPKQFVLKCTHDSGGLVICKDKSNFDIVAARKKIIDCLNFCYYWATREWPYKNVPPRIIAEKYMEDSTEGELCDYKVFCFDGKPKLIQVDFNRFVKHKRNLYTTDWEYIDMAIQFPTDKSKILPKPVNLNEMLHFAEVLSEGFSHVRCDFYSVAGKTFFGEMTFFHGGGFEKFTPEFWNEKFGSWIDLEKRK